MPAFLAMLLGGLVNICGSIAGRVLISLGISVVTYSGMTVTLNWLKSSAVTAVAGLPPDVVGMLSVLKVGTCVSIIFSAVMARLAINGLTGDTFKRWVLK